MAGFRLIGADGGKGALSAIMEGAERTKRRRSMPTGKVKTSIVSVRTKSVPSSIQPDAAPARAVSWRLVACTLLVLALVAGACGDSSGETADPADSAEDGFGVGDEADQSDDGGDGDDGDGDGDGDGDDGEDGDDGDGDDVVVVDGDAGDDSTDDSGNGDSDDDGDTGNDSGGGDDGGGTSDPYLDLPIGVAEEVKFDQGRFSGVRSGTISDQLRDVYVLEASEGQILSAVLRLEGGKLALTGPFGDRIGQGRQAFEHTLEDDGNYTITVIGAEIEGDYVLGFGVRDPLEREAPTSSTGPPPEDTTPPGPEEEFPPLSVDDIPQLEDVVVRVDTEIRFDPGTSSEIITNGVILGERDLYRFEAAAGQLLSIDMSSIEDNAVFTLIDPSGEVIDTEATDLSKILQRSGDYWMIVGSTRGNSSYTFAITII